MIVYWSACIASVFIAYLYSVYPNGQKNKRMFVFFAALPLLLISALRYGVGEDYFSTYVSYFETVRYGYDTDTTRLELIFHLLNEGVILLGSDYELMFAICAILFILPVFAQIFEDSPYPALSIFCLVTMGYLFVFFNAMRQMVGCAVLLYSIRYIQQKRFLPFAACVAIASGFHVSCLVFICMYWVGRIRIPPVVALIMTVCIVVSKEAITALLQHIISMTPYAIYFSSIFDNGQTAYVMLAINAVLLIFSSVFYHKDRKYQLYYNLQILALWITIYSGSIVLFLRLLWPFGLPSIIMLPLAAERVPKERDRKLIMAAVVLLYFFYMNYTVGVQNSNSVLPYQTVFSRWL
ncbi:MAG: EpsG family protein [Clostridiales bacterium]|nr:EpsG family protein [Clostridiales bacterium]